MGVGGGRRSSAIYAVTRRFEAVLRTGNVVWMGSEVFAAACSPREKHCGMPSVLGSAGNAECLGVAS